MMRFFRSKKGFTLVELMIVVAIIGILAGIAIPRYMNFIRRSREGATKGNLGAIRSALNIYYSDNEGIFPAAPSIASAPFVGTAANNYLDAIPQANEDCGAPTHRNNSSILGTAGIAMGTAATGAGGWEYQVGNAAGITYSTSAAKLFTNCNAADTKGVIITTW